MRSGVAVGFFDGVHLGHRAILSVAASALTFRTHPLTVLRPECAPRLIMSLDDRLAAIRSCGVERIETLDFTPDLAALSPEQFLDKAGLLRDEPIYCGENWRFGCGGVGGARLLSELGYDVRVVPFAEYHGEKISSTRIRRCLEHGEIADANAMLGRSFSTVGNVRAGKGVGRRIGYPTVNLSLDSLQLLLPFGVYVVSCCGARTIANYGVAPTFGEQAWNSPVLEVHFINGAPSDVGETVKISFERFVRPERKFSSVDELRKQIKADCATLKS